MSQNIDEVIDFYKDNMNRCEQFLASVSVFFDKNPVLNKKPFPIIHSVKSRIKDPEHLRDKILRKKEKSIDITKENLFSEITDLIGFRVLHLYQDQFPIIHNILSNYIENEKDWIFVEEPKAYSWDPETEKMYKEIGIKCEIKETYYTSVHYLIKPNNSNPNPICCEIQVRTLFEEIWGEIDHSINYPHPTDNLACKEQLRVLSKLVSTGTRLADSIYRIHNNKL